MEKCLKIYVGTPEESVEDFLYLDLIVGSYEIPVDKSNQSLSGMSGEDFLEVLGDILNTACLFSAQLKLQIRLDLDEIISEAEELDFSEADIKNIHRLIKEALE